MRLIGGGTTLEIPLQRLCFFHAPSVLLLCLLVFTGVPACLLLILLLLLLLLLLCVGRTEAEFDALVGKHSLRNAELICIHEECHYCRAGGDV